MKRLFLSLAVFVMALCANAQTNQYFWYNGNLMIGNPIAQIDSVTFGEGEPVDTLHIMLPRTIIKTVHDTLYVTIHDTICPNETPDTTHNGFRYVDLGLSVMWADANVGAENPEDYGNFFAWGEIAPKESYVWSNYKYGGSRALSKYCLNSNYGTVDGLSTLLPEDDAASVNMGGKWRIPTKAEWQELIDNCTLTLDTINGKRGYRYTASNGKSIFIPKAGNVWGETRQNYDAVHYWTANLREDYNQNAYLLMNYFYGEEIRDTPFINNHDRCIGFSVRGVFSK